MERGEIGMEEFPFWPTRADKGNVSEVGHVLGAFVFSARSRDKGGNNENILPVVKVS